jgi:regulator of nucleoside diphosphate kinase
MAGLHDTMFARPPVFATASDATDLRGLVAMAGTAAPGAGLFREEVARLAIVADDRPGRFVRLNDEVVYRDLRTKRERLVQVVRPERANQDENHVSVLAPIGAALIGLAEGAIFRWADPDGRLRAIKVVAVGA